MGLKVSKRGTIPPFIVMDVLRAANERAAAGHDVVHLEVGQPSTGAPSLVVEAAKAALDADTLGYTDALGLPELRRGIAEHYKHTYDIAVDADRVVLTVGSSGGVLLGFLSAFEAGDRVALASPGYPAYRNILGALGVEVVNLPVGAETNFQLTPTLLDRVDGAIDGLIVTSPCNPTGTMVQGDQLAALVDYCREWGVRLISDEIYHGITYGKAAETALCLTDDAIVINSFSKYFSMTGWRLGWMVLPESLLRSVECLAQNLFVSPPAISQRAALAAFESRDELDGHVRRYTRNRALLLEELPKAGYDKLAPVEGAFYIYADVAHLTNDSQEYCQRMLRETGVAATPGIDFDPERGNRFVRFSFAGATDDMAEAARRLRDWGA